MKTYQEAKKVAEIAKTALIGKTVDEASAYAKENGLEIRLRFIDGKGQVGTCDYRLNRLNLSLENNLITNITLG